MRPSLTFLPLLVFLLLAACSDSAAFDPVADTVHRSTDSLMSVGRSDSALRLLDSRSSGFAIRREWV